MRQPILVSEVDNTSRPRTLLFFTDNQVPALAEGQEESITFNWFSLKQILLETYLEDKPNPFLPHDYSHEDILKLIRKWLTNHQDSTGTGNCCYCQYCLWKLLYK